MKFNWGARIAVLYIGFVVMIVTLVAATFRSKPVLVTQDYYLRETKFQEQLDAERAASRLETPPKILRQGDSVSVLFPASLNSTQLEGSITLYFPATEGADRHIPFSTSNGRFAFQAPGHTSAAYQVQIDWVGHGVHYYYQSR